MTLYGDFQTNVRRALDEIDPCWEVYPGAIFCGSHTPDEPEELINKLSFYKQYNIPVLGICYGYQLASIEYARNMLGIKDATSEEWGNGTFVVRTRPEPRIGLYQGESYWSYYDVTIEAKFPDNWICVPFHPEYQSHKNNPHPLLIKFINICKHEMEM